MAHVQAGLVFPADDRELFDADPTNIGRIAHHGAERIQEWIERQVQRKFRENFRFDRKVSTLTKAQLGAYVPDSPYTDLPGYNDPCGQGGRWGTYINESHVLFGGKPWEDEIIMLIIEKNGGGWAGGNSNGKAGYAFLGDWHWKYAQTGQTDECAVRQYGEAFAKDDFAKAWGHEFLHALIGGELPHNPYRSYPEDLTQEQIDAILTRHPALFADVAGEEPPPPPPPPTEPTEPTEPDEPIHPMAVEVGKLYRITEGTVKLEPI